MMLHQKRSTDDYKADDADDRGDDVGNPYAEYSPYKVGVGFVGDVGQGDDVTSQFLAREGDEDKGEKLCKIGVPGVNNQSQHVL